MAKIIHIVSEQWMITALDMVKAEDDVVVAYPVPMGMHYIPESLDSLELMKTAISWKDSSLYWKLMYFAERLETFKSDGQVVVWHAQDADSRLLLYAISEWCAELFHIDLTPEGYVQKVRHPEVKHDLDEHFDPEVFSPGMMSEQDFKALMGTEKPVTDEERKEYHKQWTEWGGEDAFDSVIVVDQYGQLYHTYRTFVYSAIFTVLPKEGEMSIARLCSEVMDYHPQLRDSYIIATIIKMADETLIKWCHRERTDTGYDLVKTTVRQFKTDVAGNWLYCPEDYLYHFANEAGKKLHISEEAKTQEYNRMRQDYDNLYGRGHLAREERRRAEDERDERNLIRWAGAFNANWSWSHLMSAMHTKLEMMEDYMRHWSHIVNGPVYADQIQRAIRLIEVCLVWGGQYDYKLKPGEPEDAEYLNPEHFTHYVNTHNAFRFPSPNYDGHHFWSEAQRIRFDKAWNILWEMFRTKLLTWED